MTKQATERKETFRIMTEHSLIEILHPG